jgi:Na+-transporting methylmalonyl-CoA/oxaloacetate decarboxylase gamma subunit
LGFLFVVTFIALLAFAVWAMCEWQDNHGGPVDPTNGQPMIQQQQPPAPAGGGHQKGA